MLKVIKYLDDNKSLVELGKEKIKLRVRKTYGEISFSRFDFDRAEGYECNEVLDKKEILSASNIDFEPGTVFYRLKTNQKLLYLHDNEQGKISGVFWVMDEGHWDSFDLSELRIETKLKEIIKKVKNK